MIKIPEIKPVSAWLSRVAPTLPSLQVVDVHNFIKMELPHRENILSPWLPAQGLAMIYAPRGIGKTYVALGVAYAVASNTSFLGWQPPKARNVLYLDGEMPASLMQERLSKMINQKHLLQAAFHLLTPDLQNNLMPNLATQKGQVMIEPYLKNTDLIIVDNISTLCRSSKENEADSWLPVQDWALKMRASGKSFYLFIMLGKVGIKEEQVSVKIF